MAKKGRGREPLVNCSSCGRKVPRSKAVQLDRPIVYSTDTKTKDEVRAIYHVKEVYCPSCGKHKHIYERKKRMFMRGKE